jgi:hypothetical protein
VAEHDKREHFNSTHLFGLFAQHNNNSTAFGISFGYAKDTLCRQSESQVRLLDIKDRVSGSSSYTPPVAALPCHAIQSVRFMQQPSTLAVIGHEHVFF